LPAKVFSSAVLIFRLDERGERGAGEGGDALGKGPKKNPPTVSCLYLPPAVYPVHVRGEDMETTQWLVTLTFRVTVSGVRSKDDSVAAGLEQLKLGLCSGEDVPMEASVRRITNIVEEEPIFGVKW